MTMDFLAIAKILVVALILPPGGPLLLIAGGLLALRRAKRLGAALAWLGVTALLVLSMPIVSASLTLLMDDAPVFGPRNASTAEAIVILGGGMRRAAPEYGGDTLNCLTLERVRYGAWLAEQTGLPILVTGGYRFAGPSEAQVMRQALEKEFRIPVRWVEGISRNTHENAILSAKVLREFGLRRIILVSHAVDIRRARSEFEKAGFEVVPAPTVVPQPSLDSYKELMPDAAALQSSTLVLYELMANVAYGARLHSNRVSPPPAHSTELSTIPQKNQ
jgi:uncharacterized SAM-binding protein YcdF (DUF218 family)